MDTLKKNFLSRDYFLSIKVKKIKINYKDTKKL